MELKASLLFPLNGKHSSPTFTLGLHHSHPNPHSNRDPNTIQPPPPPPHRPGFKIDDEGIKALVPVVEKFTAVQDMQLGGNHFSSTIHHLSTSHSPPLTLTLNPHEPTLILTRTFVEPTPSLSHLQLSQPPPPHTDQAIRSATKASKRWPPSSPRGSSIFHYRVIRLVTQASQRSSPRSRQ
jgi:hypothetical protein